MSSHNFIDLTGMKFGRLEVVSRSENDKIGKARWNCLCECGNFFTVCGNNMRSGGTKSCGCLDVEKIIERSTKHGHATRKKRSEEFQIWSLMLDRCTNENSPSFKNYGGRGITVCDRWKDFKNFYEDMGNRPSSKHSIDRENNDGNYDPSNCRWATITEQNINQRIRKDNISGTRGVNEKDGKWIARISLNNKRLYLGVFDDIEKAIQARKEAELKYWK